MAAAAIYLITINTNYYNFRHWLWNEHCVLHSQHLLHCHTGVGAAVSLLLVQLDAALVALQQRVEQLVPSATYGHHDNHVYRILSCRTRRELLGVDISGRRSRRQHDRGRLRSRVLGGSDSSSNLPPITTGDN